MSDPAATMTDMRYVPPGRKGGTVRPAPAGSVETKLVRTHRSAAAVVTDTDHRPRIPMAQPAPSTARRIRRSVSQLLLAEILGDELAAWQQLTGTDPVTIVDLGGGTGGLATDLAAQGHPVTVVDPSPDALASLERRAAEAGLAGSVTAVQGDAADVVELLGPDSVDVMICHRVLDVVDQPLEALRSMATCLRPDGMLSLVVAGRRAAAISAALGGQIGAAREALHDERRYDPDQVKRLLSQAGFEITAQHGVGAIADIVAESSLESHQAREQLIALEREISLDPAFRAVAPHLHVVARPVDRGGSGS